MAEETLNRRAFVGRGIKYSIAGIFAGLVSPAIAFLASKRGDAKAIDGETIGNVKDGGRREFPHSSQESTLPERDDWEVAKLIREWGIEELDALRLRQAVIDECALYAAGAAFVGAGFPAVYDSFELEKPLDISDGFKLSKTPALLGHGGLNRPMKVSMSCLMGFGSSLLAMQRGSIDSNDFYGVANPKNLVDDYGFSPEKAAGFSQMYKSRVLARSIVLSAAASGAKELVECVAQTAKETWDECDKGCDGSYISDRDFRME